MNSIKIFIAVLCSIVFSANVCAQKLTDTEVSNCENAVYVSEVDCIHGMLKVCMNTTFTAKALQFEIVLPEGMSFVEDGDGAYSVNRTSRISNSFTITMANADKTTNSALLLCSHYTNTKASISGTSGEILNIPVVISSSLKDNSEILINRVNITEVGYKEHDLSQYTFSTTVGLSSSMPGDMNLDGKVSVDDLVLLINMLSNTPNVSSTKNADMDNDGKLTKNDILLMVNKILGQ